MKTLFGKLFGFKPTYDKYRPLDFGPAVVAAPPAPNFKVTPSVKKKKTSAVDLKKPTAPKVGPATKPVVESTRASSSDDFISPLTGAAVSDYVAPYEPPTSAVGDSCSVSDNSSTSGSCD